MSSCLASISVLFDAMHAGSRKTALQLMTGSKAPTYTIAGNRIRTEAPIEGVNRTLLLW